jgi:replication factor A1
VQYKQESDDQENFTPINALAPFINDGWKIKARVTKKGQLKTFTNSKGEGKLLGLDLIDADDSEIQCTFFGTSAEKFS